MSDARAARAPRLVALDGLRGVAASVVFVHHSLLAVPQVAHAGYAERDAGPWDWFLYSPLHIVAAGTEAVVVFFVLSGLVLTLPAARPQYSWRAYYPSRMIRLYLPVAASLAWALVMVTVFPRGGLAGSPNDWLRAHAVSVDGVTALRDLTLLTGTSYLNGPLWSLRWEVVFSLLLPLYVAVVLRIGRTWGIWLALAIAAPGLVTAIGVPGLQYLPMFAVGALGAVRLDHILTLCARVNRVRAAPAVWTGVALLATLGLTSAWTLGPLLGAVGLATTLPLVVLGAALWVLLALGSPLARSVLSQRAVQWMGRVSFSFYLTHEPVIIAVAQALPRDLAGFTGLIAAPVALVVAWGFFMLVERPSHRLAQRARRRALQPSATRRKARSDDPSRSGHRRAADS